MKYKIEKDIPLPETRGRSPKYPWLDMVPGDSFLMDKRGNHAASCAHYASKKYGITLACRPQPGGTTRVWRTA